MAPALSTPLRRYVVYFIAGRTAQSKGARHVGSVREYVGYTEQAVWARELEHDGGARGATWLKLVELEGEPVVLWTTDDEGEALAVELLAVLWRFKRARPYRNGCGGRVRGAVFLRPTLEEGELALLDAVLPELAPCAALSQEVPAPLSKEDVARGRAEVLQGNSALRRSADVRRHFAKQCFNCAGEKHHTRQCPLYFAAPAPAVAPAAPAAPRRPVFTVEKCGICKRHRPDGRCAKCGRKWHSSSCKKFAVPRCELCKRHRAGRCAKCGRRPAH